MPSLRAALAALSIAGVIAWPVVAAACSASETCPLKAVGAGSSECHGSHPSRSSDPNPQPAQDARDCCEALQAPAAKTQGPTLEPLVRWFVPAVAIAGDTLSLPTGRAALPRTVERVRGAPLIALHCTLLL